MKSSRSVEEVVPVGGEGDLARELRDTGALLPPEAPPDPDESHHNTATDGTRPD
ncbi:hypothetical protein [Streptomyces avermitilis]|uniref:hypothetical protein n=1 Tax=Streptomyces avermitilis TaxID=33903 RepID=UPI0038063F8D